MLLAACAGWRPPAGRSFVVSAFEHKRTPRAIVSTYVVDKYIPRYIHQDRY